MIRSADGSSGTVVLLASLHPLGGLLPRDRSLHVLRRAEVERFAAGAEVLTDDHAPADQLLAPRR